MRGTPKLNKREDSPYWYITFSTGRRSRRFSTGKTDRAQAEKFLARFLIERQAPQLTDADKLRVIDMLERYELHKIKDATVGYHMKRLKPWFENVMLSQLSNNLVREYISFRTSTKAKQGKDLSERYVSPATVRRELDTLSAAIGLAKSDGYVTAVPVIEKPAASPARERWLTHEEAGKLFSAASNNKRLMAFIEIALNTGQRPSSILELKWFQVDMEKRLIHFNPDGRVQNNKHRPTVYINDTLLASLEGLKRDSEYVLGGIQTIKPQFRRAVERAKLKDVTPYTLRHTAITWAIREGHSLALAGQLAGHRDPRTTMRYAKHDPSFTQTITGTLATGAQLAHNHAEIINNEKAAAKKKVDKQCA